MKVSHALIVTGTVAALAAYGYQRLLTPEAKEKLSQTTQAVINAVSKAKDGVESARGVYAEDATPQDHKRQVRAQWESLGL